MKRFLVTILSLFPILFFIAASAGAGTETFTREYTYKAGDADSKLSSRVIALEQVKRLLLEELGVFLSSRTEVRDFQLTKDEIVTYTAGTVATIIIEERWNGTDYYMKASIKADPDQVAKSIQDIQKDQDGAEELRQSRNQASAALSEIERLKRELAELKKASSNSDNAKIEQVHKEYDQAVAGLSAKEIADKGITLAKEKKSAEAIEQFNLAMKADPKALAPYGMRGQVYLSMKEPDKAIQDFDRVLALKPNHPIALKNRGQAYYQHKNYNLARIDFERALEFKKRDPKLLIELGRTYQQTRRHKDAVHSFTKSIELDPAYAPAFMLRHFSYRALKMNDEAQKDLETAVRLGDPKAKELWEKTSGRQSQ